MQRVAGVDGCKSGWIVVECDCDLSKAELQLAPKWDDITSAAKIVAVDMPIGLSRNGVRQCEVEARKLISPCGPRVFKTLPREALRFAQENWNAANQWSKDQGFGGISKQIWAIRPKIKEIDNAISPPDQARIVEAHPELAFARLNGGKPLDSKHTKAGLKARQEILARAGFTNLDSWLQMLRGKGAKADDLYDACALVLTARNHLRGQGRFVPQKEERDSRGLRMAIAY
jgi:predicted RNase H-like nuclease